MDAMTGTAPTEIESKPRAISSVPAILVVDDDERNLLAFSELLGGLGAQVVCASSGSDALRLILQMDFALILLDVRMAGMDGYETAALIRQREKSRRIPIIFLTAAAPDEAHLFRGYSAGAVDYVFKPIEPFVLRAKVQVFIELSKQADEIRLQADQERRLLEENVAIRAAKLETEELLRRSEARQAVIIRSLPIALYEAEATANGMLRTFVHDNVARLLGFGPADFEKDPSLWASRVHPSDWQAVHEALKRGVSAGDYSVEYRWRCSDDSYRYFLDQGVLAREGDGNGTKFFGTLFDLHERRMLEQQLVHAQKLDAIGRLTGGIAHDFNNMLTVVIGNLDRIRRKTELDEAAARRLDYAMQGALRCVDMTRRLLTFARRQPLSPQALNLNEVIDGLRELLHRTIGGEIRVEFDLAGDLWPVLADPAQLEAAVVNLMVNSRDAMSGGGRIAIKTYNREIELPSGAVGDLTAGAYVVLEVADDGTGMTKEVLAQALEPFFTTKDVGRGTGLGLSTIHGFVKQSGGDLVLDSEPGRGTTVWIYLPRAVAEQSQPLRHSGDAPSAALPRARAEQKVLVVEDDPGVLQTTTGILKELGYRVMEAGCATDALRVLETGEKIDLLFTDVVMPGEMNGFNLGVEATRLRPGLKVLYTSGHSGTLAAEIGGDNAFTPLLRKPYRDYELASALHAALG